MENNKIIDLKDNPYEYYFPIINTDNKERLLYYISKDSTNLPNLEMFNFIRSKLIEFFNYIDDVNLMYFTSVKVTDNCIQLKSSNRPKSGSTISMSCDFVMEINFHPHSVSINLSKDTNTIRSTNYHMYRARVGHEKYSFPYVLNSRELFNLREVIEIKNIKDKLHIDG